jgi:pyruvate/2-oxoglutarate dehydrogenase complex dihydrolipoamide acyltransferase (E2) component
VLTDDGAKVDVDASLALLKITADPSKAGVRERWAAMRQATQAAAEPAAAAQAQAAEPAPPAQPSLIEQPAAAPAAAEPEAAKAAPASSAYHDARTLREQTEAEISRIELRKLQGTVLDADLTLRAIADAQTAACTEVLTLPDRVTQLVAAEVDPRKVHTILREDCERICERISTWAQRMAAKHVMVPA